MGEYNIKGAATSEETVTDETASGAGIGWCQGSSCVLGWRPCAEKWEVHVVGTSTEWGYILVYRALTPG